MTRYPLSLSFIQCPSSKQRACHGFGDARCRRALLYTSFQQISIGCTFGAEDTEARTGRDALRSCYASRISRRSRSAIMAINSLLVGLPLALETV